MRILSITLCLWAAAAASAQDFTGSWTFLVNGFKYELYLKQQGRQVQGWMGVGGVNVHADSIAGTANGKEIRFTRSNPQLRQPQQYHGYLLVHNDRTIEADRRAAGNDTMAGTGVHVDMGNFGWWGARTGAYREPPAASGGSPSLVGPWTCDGQPTSITQDAAGRLVFVNQRGVRSSGRFADPSTVVATEWEGGLRGALQDNARTIRWGNGTVWKRQAAPSLPALAGTWTCDGQPTSITQDAAGKLVFVNQRGMRSSGVFADPSTVVATEWEGGLRGTLHDNARTIRWGNGTMWRR